MPARGLERATLRTYDVKTKISASGKPVSVGFRYPWDGYKVRSLHEKSFLWSGEHRNGLFGRDKFAAGSHSSVTITEGEYDACSLYQVLRGPPVVSVQSSSSAYRDCVADRDYLNSFERIYLAFDSDPKGREAAALVARLFDRDKVFDVKFSNRKDANEYLQAGEDVELLNIWKNAKRYLPDTLVSSLDQFKKILTSSTALGVPYPFECLNEMTYGIRKGETVLFLAQEKVGKTEVMHAIEYQFLKYTEERVGAIFLEEPPLRHLQALAGIELRRPVHLPDVDCTTDQVISALEKVVRMDERLFIYSHFGNSDADQILDTVRYLVSACGCGLVVFDHITMGVVGSSGMDDERRTLDYLITRLEMMVKELNFALIIVSHVNDVGQSRGSHYLTKVADITIRAERDLMSPDPIIRNTLELSIPYNRFCGRTGYAGSVIFNPDTYSYMERKMTNAQANDNTRRIEELVA